VNEQVKAYGGPGYQVAQDVMARVAAAISQSGVQIVPSTVISMGDGGGDGASAFSNLHQMAWRDLGSRARVRRPAGRVQSCPSTSSPGASGSGAFGVSHSLCFSTT